MKKARLKAGLAKYRVRSGALDWHGTAISIDDALDKALDGYSGGLGELIRIDVPRETPTPKRSHVAYYARTISQPEKRGMCELGKVQE